MKIHELQKQIVAGTLDKVFIFTGDEAAVMDIYLNKMCEVLGAKKTVQESVLDAYNKETKGSFGGELVLHIVYYDYDFLKEEKKWENVFEAFNEGTDYLVLVYTDLDKRGKFYKKYKDTITAFERLADEVLLKYVQAELHGISRPCALDIVEACNGNYSAVLSECNKLVCLQKALERLSRPCTWKSVLDYYRTQNGLQRTLQDVTFDLANALLQRKYKDVQELSEHYKASGNSALLILSALYTVFRNAVLVLGLGNDTKNAETRTGLSSWQIVKTRELLGAFSLAQAVKALTIISSTEEDIKTGQCQESWALDTVIVRICGL